MEINPFVFQSPTKIYFGEGTTFGIADALAEAGCRNPLIVSDQVLMQNGVLAPLLKALSESGISNPCLFLEVPSDSDLECVRKAVRLGKEMAVDGLLAVGGGSVIDTAKVVNIGLSLDGDILDHEGINSLSSRLLPLVAIPTTSGTGSEVSAVAMIKDHQTGKKLLFGSRFLFADAAILDPSLLLSLPPRLTAATGLDAITHAIESYSALCANPFSDALALHSLSMLIRYLPKATRSGDDLESRSRTLLASSMAGMAFTSSGVGIVHALAHTIGGRYGVHHGLANAIFLPHGMQFNMQSGGHRYDQVWSHLCHAFAACSSEDPQLSARFVLSACDREAASNLINAVKDILRECSLPMRLRDVGVPELSESDLQELAETAMTDPAIMFNPREAALDEIVNIIKEAY